MNEAISNAQGHKLGDDDWLIVVDMQRCFAAAGSVWEVEGFWDVVPRIERLIALYGKRTIMTRFVSANAPDNAWRDYLQHYPSMDLPEASPEWDIVLNYPKDAHLETRATFSKWDARLASITGRKARLTICGVATECCVLATVFAAIDDGHSVRVVEDACAGATSQLHEHTLAILSGFMPLVRVVTLHEIVR